MGPKYTRSTSDGVMPVPDAACNAVPDALTSVTLILGFTHYDLPRLPHEAIPKGTTVYFSNMPAISSEVLSDIEPDMIISPLIVPEFDAVDIAKKLAELRYRGTYRVLSQRLPNTKMVCREISNCGHDLRIEFMELASQS